MEPFEIAPRGNFVAKLPKPFSVKFNRLFAETRCSYTQLRHLGHFASQEIAASGPVAQCSELAADNSLVGKVRVLPAQPRIRDRTEISRTDRE